MQSTITIQLLQRDEANRFKNIAPDVFDDDVNEQYCEEFLADPRHHIAVAFDEDLIVGMATAVHYIHPDKPNELWINEVGVSPMYLRQGIGQKLLNKLLEHAKQLGCQEAWVLTEEENKAARGLYKAVGGKEQMAVYVTFPLE